MVKKAVYGAVDERSALNALETFAQRWDKKYPKISSSWRANWPALSTYFKYPQEIRQLIYRRQPAEDVMPGHDGHHQKMDGPTPGLEHHPRPAGGLL